VSGGAVVRRAPWLHPGQRAAGVARARLTPAAGMEVASQNPGNLNRRAEPPRCPDKTKLWRYARMARVAPSPAGRAQPVPARPAGVARRVWRAAARREARREPSGRGWAAAHSRSGSFTARRRLGGALSRPGAVTHPAILAGGMAPRGRSALTSWADIVNADVGAGAKPEVGLENPGGSHALAFVDRVCHGGFA